MTVDAAIENLKNSARANSDDFMVKLINNVSVLLLLFDNFFIKEDFVHLPGDEVSEPKRTNIKRLARKKISGQLGQISDKRGYKRTWPGIDLTPLCLPNE